MPLTRFRSSALRNGRAAIMRDAITCPIPGTVVSSFSVAVLMSIFPSGVFSFARFFTSPGLLAAANELDVRVTGIEREASGDACGCGPIPFDGCPVTPHPPTCRRFASFSSCASFSRSSAEVEPRRWSTRAVDSRESVGDQLFAEIAFFGSHKSIDSLDFASS